MLSRGLPGFYFGSSQEAIETPKRGSGSLDLVDSTLGCFIIQTLSQAVEICPIKGSGCKFTLAPNNRGFRPGIDKWRGPGSVRPLSSENIGNGKTAKNKQKLMSNREDVR